MIDIELAPHQMDAFLRARSGCIFAGGTGSGKSRTALAFYYIRVCAGGQMINGSGSYHKMRQPRDLYIITTAKKRDDREWEDELSTFGLSSGINRRNSDVKIMVDSWNNIKNYTQVKGAFFIFDEQRVVGSGAWVRAFLKITRSNPWVMLSATPGDKWTDYIPVFIANGFYRNRREFHEEHCVFARFSKYPKIEKYINEGILQRHRNDILLRMDFDRKTSHERTYVRCSYDKKLYRTVWRDRCDPYEDNEPIEETGKLFYLLRKVVNSDASRIIKLCDIFRDHPKLIIFYNFTYERDRIREEFRSKDIDIGEWNGQVHSEVPDGSRWVYLVQYSAGSEGWNCITTDTIVFYSQSYSYRMTKQAEGRIDRLNTPFDIMHYYYLVSDAPIDLAIRKALSTKKNFNERAFTGRKGEGSL